MREIFKASDFEGLKSYEEDYNVFLARFCNKKLQELIDKAPVVYKSEIYDAWWPRHEKQNDVYQARLMFIEKIMPKVCEHAPTQVNYSFIDGAHTAFRPICKHCGIKLKAKWEVVR